MYVHLCNYNRFICYFYWKHVNKIPFLFIHVKIDDNANCICYERCDEMIMKVIMLVSVDSPPCQILINCITMMKYIRNEILRHSIFDRACLNKITIEGRGFYYSIYFIEVSIGSYINKCFCQHMWDDGMLRHENIITICVTNLCFAKHFLKTVCHKKASKALIRNDSPLR